MTKDLAICVHGTTNVSPDQYLHTEPFIDAIASTFEKRWGHASFEAAEATVEATVEGGAGGALEWWVDGEKVRTDAVDSDPWVGSYALTAPAQGEARVRAMIVRDGLPRTLTSHIWLRLPADSGVQQGKAEAGACGCTGSPGAGPLALALALIPALRRRPRRP